MANIKEMRHGGNAYPLADEQARQNIGDLSKLKTAAKKSLVDAVNEVKEQGSGGTTDYSALSNKPKINGVELNGDKKLSDLGIDTGGGALDTSVLILPNVSPNLWNGEYKVGSFTPTTGVIDESVTTSYYAEIELEPNTDYTVFAKTWFVKYPADWSYSTSNYKKLNAANGSGTFQPFTFNSGDTFKYCRFGVSIPPTNASAVNAYTNLQHFIVKGASVDEKIGAYSKTFGTDALPPHSFYRSVASKLTDLMNPFKPTAVSMIGDSITAGYHSYNHAYIENCYAKLFGDYLLERFNGKVHNIPLLDERVINYGAGNGKNLETSGALNQGDNYVQMDFYGSYIAVNSFAGQKPDANISIHIDGELYATHNFAATDTTKWEDENLSMDYHTIRLESDSSATLGSIGIKKYVTFTNRAVSGINSTTVRTYFANDRKFDNDDIVFCMIGTNDRSEGNVGLYDFNVRQVFKHGLEAMGKQVILMSATPSPREGYEVGAENSEATYNYAMRDVVAWVNLIGGKENEQVISFYNWLLDYAEEHNAELGSFFNDGLHPTEACHALMFEHLLRECGFGINM